MGNCARKERRKRIQEMQAKAAAAARMEEAQLLSRAGLASPQSGQAGLGGSGLGLGLAGRNDVATAASDLSGALSGYGGGGLQYGYIHEEECPEGINENLALLITGAAIAAGAFVVYRDITLRLGKRKKREEEVPGEVLASKYLDPVFLGRSMHIVAAVQTAKLGEHGERQKPEDEQKEAPSETPQLIRMIFACPARQGIDRCMDLTME